METVKSRYRPVPPRQDVILLDGRQNTPDCNSLNFYTLARPLEQRNIDQSSSATSSVTASTSQSLTAASSINTETINQSAIDTSSLSTSELFECDICNKEWTIESVGYESENIMLCSFCKEEYIDGKGKQKGQRRKEMKQKEEEFRCIICHGILSTAEKLINHLNDDHDVEDSKILNLLTTTKRRDALKSTVACPSCPVRFASNSQLNAHQKRFHNSTAPTNYRCNYCQACFAEPGPLAQHTRLHKIAEEKKKKKEKVANKCSTCGLAFTMYKDLISHSKLVHGNLMVRSVTPTERVPGRVPHGLQCPSCLVGFSLPSQLITHQRNCHSSPKYPCQQCDAGFAFSKNLQYHMQLHDEYLSHHQCPMCPKKFRLYHSLQCHIRFEHKKECRLCDLRFDSIQDLKKHRRIHLCYRKATTNSVEKPSNYDGVLVLD